MRLIGNERKQEKKKRFILRKKNTPLRGSTLFHYTVKKKKRVLKCKDVTISCGDILSDVNQCTLLKMSAATLLPVLPPNWKVGVDNSCTNSNPVKQHKENAQVMKCTLQKNLADGQNLLSSSVVLLLKKKGAELSEDPLTICDASWGASENRLSL